MLILVVFVGIAVDSLKGFYCVGLRQQHNAAFTHDALVLHRMSRSLRWKSYEPFLFYRSVAGSLPIYHLEDAYHQCKMTLRLSLRGHQAYAIFSQRHNKVS